jgi:hypothetical protein
MAEEEGTETHHSRGSGGDKLAMPLKVHRGVLKEVLVGAEVAIVGEARQCLLRPSPPLPTPGVRMRWLVVVAEVGLVIASRRNC